MASEYMEGMPEIVAIRLDDRLIHGQIVSYWSSYLKLTRIIVANDDVAQDDMRKTVLRMAAPSGINTSIISVERAARQILDRRYSGQRCLLIVDAPADIIRLRELGLPIETFNVGNLGGKEGTRAINRYINLTAEQDGQFRSLIEQGVDITTQVVPQDPITRLTDYLK